MINQVIIHISIYQYMTTGTGMKSKYCLSYIWWYCKYQSKHRMSVHAQSLITHAGSSIILHLIISTQYLLVVTLFTILHSCGSDQHAWGCVYMVQNHFGDLSFSDLNLTVFLPVAHIWLLRHVIHFGPTGRHVCWPNPTSRRFISLQ